MKSKSLLAMGLCAAIGLMGASATTISAAEHGPGSGEHAATGEKMKIPETVDGIFAAIHEHYETLEAAVEGKKLSDVHKLAFAIRDLANALVPKAPPDKKKQVEDAAKNIAKLADDLDASGDAGDQAKTEANLKKFDGVLKVLMAHFGMKMDEKEGGHHAH